MENFTRVLPVCFSRFERMMMVTILACPLPVVFVWMRLSCTLPFFQLINPFSWKSIMTSQIIYYKLIRGQSLKFTTSIQCLSVLTPWNRVLLGKLVVTHQSKNSMPNTESAGSLRVHKCFYTTENYTKVAHQIL